MRHYLRFDKETIVEFDDAIGKFGLFFRDDDDIDEEDVLKVDDWEKAAERTAGRRILRCGSCKAIGHNSRSCITKGLPKAEKEAEEEPEVEEKSKVQIVRIVKPWEGECQDCGWSGTLTVPLLDAVCRNGHIHVKPITP